MAKQVSCGGETLVSWRFSSSIKLHVRDEENHTLTFPSSWGFVKARFRWTNGPARAPRSARAEAKTCTIQAHRERKLSRKKRLLHIHKRVRQELKNTVSTQPGEMILFHQGRSWVKTLIWSDITTTFSSSGHRRCY